MIFNYFKIFEIVDKPITELKLNFFRFPVVCFVFALPCILAVLFAVGKQIWRLLWTFTSEFVLRKSLNMTSKLKLSFRYEL